MSGPAAAAGSLAAREPAADLPLPSVRALRRRALRLAVVSDAVYPWHKGGKEMRYFDLLAAVDRSRLAPVVYTMQWWDGPAPDGHAALSARVEMYAGDRRSIVQALRFSLATVRLLREPFDVIEADHMPYLQLFPLRVVASLRGVPLIVTWHELWGAAYWREYLGFPGLLAAFLEHAATRLPTRIVSVSAHTTQRLLAAGVHVDRLATLAPGIDLAAIDASVPAPSGPDLLFVGRLIEHKRVEDAITAVALLKDAGRPECLSIVGTGPHEPALRSLVAALDVADRVVFLGELPERSDVFALLRSARVLLFPSVREGFGMAVAEALAAGTPVVLTDHADNEAASLVDESVTGSKVAPLDPQALAERAVFWLDHPSDPDALRSGVREQFLTRHPQPTWQTLARAYAALVEDAHLSSRAARSSLTPSPLARAARALVRTARSLPSPRQRACSCSCHASRAAAS